MGYLYCCLCCVDSCRFNWVDEAVRAKQLVAAGELVLEEEEPLDSGGDSYADDYISSGINHDSSSGYNSSGDGDKGPSDGQGAARRNTARPDRGLASGYQVKVVSSESARLLG